MTTEIRTRIQDIKKGDVFIAAGELYAAGEDAHKNLDEPDEPWIVYDTAGGSWFEEDIEKRRCSISITESVKGDKAFDIRVWDEYLDERQEDLEMEGVGDIETAKQMVEKIIQENPEIEFERDMSYELGEDQLIIERMIWFYVKVFEDYLDLKDLNRADRGVAKTLWGRLIPEPKEADDALIRESMYFYLAIFENYLDMEDFSKSDRELIKDLWKNLEKRSNR